LSRLDPEDLGVQERLGLSLSRDGQWAEALPLLENVLAKDKSRSEAVAVRGALAECYVRASKADQAEQTYAKLCREDPGTAEWRFRLGECYAARHDDGAALEQVELALKAEPGHANAHALAGYLCFSTGKLAAAEEHLRKAMDRTDQPALVAALLAKTFQAQGREDAAAEVWTQFGGRAEAARQSGAVDQVAASSPHSWGLSGEASGESVKQ